VLPAMVKKTMQLHMLLGLVKATTILVNFDLWMSKSGVGTFALVINYLNDLGCPNMLPFIYLRFMRPLGFRWLVNLFNT
jgi:hypothetical protein